MTRYTLACLLGLLAAGPVPGEEKVWQDWDKAREAARAQGKPIFLVFR